MKAIETTRIGVRNARPATVIPVPAGVDAHVFLALILEEKRSDGYIVSGSYGNRDTFGLRQIGMVDGIVLKIRLVEVETVEVAQAS